MGHPYIGASSKRKTGEADTILATRPVVVAVAHGNRSGAGQGGRIQGMEFVAVVGNV